MRRIIEARLSAPRSGHAKGPELEIVLDVGRGYAERYLVPMGESRDPRADGLTSPQGGAYGPSGRYTLWSDGHLILDLDTEQVRKLVTLFEGGR